MSQDDTGENSVWKRVPGFAKIIMLLQSAIIIFLSVWIYQEYLNNPYLQAYVNSYLQANTLTILAFTFILSFTTVALTLYSKLRNTRKELEEVLSTTEPTGANDGRPTSLLDPRTEQHLIEMIKKTTPETQPPPPAATAHPILKREDPQPPPPSQPPP